MFYDLYNELCQEKGVSCSRAAKEIGLSNSTVTKWKNTGATPSGDTLSKVAAYFGVSVNYLIGEQKKTTTQGNGITDDDIKIPKITITPNNSTSEIPFSLIFFFINYLP